MLCGFLPQVTRVAEAQELIPLNPVAPQVFVTGANISPPTVTAGDTNNVWFDISVTGYFTSSAMYGPSGVIQGGSGSGSYHQSFIPPQEPGTYSYVVFFQYPGGNESVQRILQVVPRPTPTAVSTISPSATPAPSTATPTITRVPPTAIPTVTPTITPTLAPTATPMPPTATPTPCPTLPPQPTATATSTPGPSDVGVVTSGTNSCRSSEFIPFLSLPGNGGQSCPNARIATDLPEAAAALMQLPACQVIDNSIYRAIVDVCGNEPITEWQANNGSVITGQKFTCSRVSASGIAGTQDVQDVTQIAMISWPTAAAAASLATLPVGVTVVAVVVTAGVVYAIVTYEGEIPSPAYTIVDKQWLADEWILGQVRAGMWPATPYEIKTVESQDQVVVKTYDNWSSPRTVSVVEAATRPYPNGSEVALIQLQISGQLLSYLLVEQVGDNGGRDILGTPVTLRYPEEALNQLSLEMGDNWFMSTRHHESSGIIAAVMNDGNIIRTKGDGSSNGSIQLWAGVNDAINQARIGGIYISTNRVAYIAFRTSVQSGPGQGLKRLGESQWYYNPQDVKWWCAWMMTSVIGHEAHPEVHILPLAEGLRKWEGTPPTYQDGTKARYGLTIPVAVLYLP